MNNFELIRQLLKRLKKFSWLILLIAAGFGGLFYYMAKRSVLLYTSKATVFPLNSSSDNIFRQALRTALAAGHFR